MLQSFDSYYVAHIATLWPSGPTGSSAHKTPWEPGPAVRPVFTGCVVPTARRRAGLAATRAPLEYVRGAFVRERTSDVVPRDDGGRDQGDEYSGGAHTAMAVKQCAILMGQAAAGAALREHVYESYNFNAVGMTLYTQLYA